MRRRSSSLICSVVAIFAMAISAIAACACTHHQARETEKKVISCHGASHETESPEVSNDEPSGPYVDESCNCYLNRVQPAITAKSEQKKFKTQQSDVAENGASIEVDHHL